MAIINCLFFSKLFARFEIQNTSFFARFCANKVFLLVATTVVSGMTAMAATHKTTLSTCSEKNCQQNQLKKCIMNNKYIAQ